MLFGFAGPCFISLEVLPRLFRFCCFHCCSFCLAFTEDYLLEGGNSKFSLGNEQNPVCFHVLNSLVMGGIVHY